MPERPTGFAAVGLGWVTTNRHIPALQRSPDAELIGVVDHQLGRAEQFAAKHGIPNSATVDMASAVEWLDRIDAVTIGTPPVTHYQIARQYLECGKHVLLEKPMSMSVADAEHLKQFAAEKNLVLGIVHNFQFSDCVQRALRMIRSGELGEIRSLWAVQLSNPSRRLPIWYEELPLGLFYDESPHFFYLIRALTGSDPTFTSIQVTPNKDRTNTPSKVGATLDANGIRVQVDMDFQATVSEWHIGILGSKRAAAVDVFRDITVVVSNDGLHRGRDILRTTAEATWSHLSGTLQSGVRLLAGRLSYGNDEVVRRFIRACNGDTGALAGISPSDGVAVVRMQHQVIDAA